VNDQIQVYTGDGKGKTTAAFGLTVRAAGHGLRTYIGQFMKGQSCGELEALRGHPLITIEQYGGTGCIRREEVTVEDVARARHGLERALEAMLSGRHAIVVLDEVTLRCGSVCFPLERCWRSWIGGPSQAELVLTGRHAVPEVIEKASLVTGMREVKHCYRDGLPARDGIER
jgi:cob(I)alamin adenosyltransferase